MHRYLKILAIAGAALALAPRPSPAQLPHLMPPGSNWLDVNYPKVFWTPRDGVTGGAYLAFVRQLDFENSDSPAPYGAVVSMDGQLSTGGSRQLVLETRLPAFVHNWRFAVTAEAVRRAHDNYYGVGNDAVYDEHLVNDAQPEFYQARATRLVLRTEAQRIIVAHFRALAGFQTERWKLAPPEGPSQLRLDSAAGVDPTIGQMVDDITLRFGLVFDSRDDEVAANSGILAYATHAIAKASIAGDLDYTRTTAAIQAYRQVTENLVLTGRFMGQGMGGTPRTGSYYLVDVPERPYFGIGGAMSHRAMFDNRLLGRNKLQLNLDARYHIINLPRTARLTLVGFLDTGRVFEGESFKLTTKGLKTGGGLGLFFQLARAGIVGMNAGYGPNGAVLDFATRWTY